MMGHQNSSFLGKFLRDGIVINVIDNLRINSCQWIIHQIKISIRVECSCKIDSGPLTTTENVIENDSRARGKGTLMLHPFRQQRSDLGLENSRNLKLANKLV